jgi:hypothetical protein
MHPPHTNMKTFLQLKESLCDRSTNQLCIKGLIAKQETFVTLKIMDI